MKIAILCPIYNTLYGIERVVSDQAKELVSYGHDVTLFVLEGTLQPPPSVRIEIMGMPKTLLLAKIYYLLFPFNFINTLKWIKKSRYFDVIYSHDYPMHWLAFVANRKYQVEYVCYHHHFNPPEAYPSLIEHIYIRLKFPLQKWLMKRCSRAISISEYSNKQLKKETGLDSEIIFNKIDNNRFHKNINGTKIREKHNLKNDPVIFFAGRITAPTKGVHLLIEAFNLVLQRYKNAKLLLVGKQDNSKYFRKAQEMSNDSIIYTGYVNDDELPLYYGAADVCATGSLAEGFNLFVAEAVACGKPVVAFDIGPHYELVKNRRDGTLVPVNDTKAMANSIIKFLELRGERPLD